MTNNKVQFSFTPNQSYTFHINETYETKNAIGKETTVNTFSTDVNLLYKTLKSASHEPDVQVRFSGAAVSNITQGQSEEEDIVNPFQEGIKAFNGAAFNITLTQEGEVSGMLGYADFKKGFLRLYDSVATKEDPLAEWTVYKESFFKDIFNAISHSLPGKSIAVNDTWERMEPEDLGGEKNIKNIYKCDKILNGIAYLSSAAPVTRVLTNHNGAITFNGTVKGIYELDASTGMVINGKRTIEMTGIVKFRTTDVVMTVRKTISITGQKITE